LALFRQDPHEQRHRHAHLPSPFHGVSTQDVVDALGASFSPVELDWELVGVTFVHAIEVDVAPELPAGPQARPPKVVQGIGAAIARKRRRKWLREHDQIIASVRDLSWEGYLSLIADIFRREGYEVFVGEGPDSDVIDMEVTRGDERMLVNCQLRGLTQIDAAPLVEMAAVVDRNGADGAFLISDGDFAPEAWSLADAEPIVLLDRDVLLGLVLDLTIGVEKEKRFTARLARLFSAIQPSSRQRAS
jgi:restriction endonuclease